LNKKSLSGVELTEKTVSATPSFPADTMPRYWVTGAATTVTFPLTKFSILPPRACWKNGVHKQRKTKIIQTL